jgi:hypothetical protein
MNHKLQNKLYAGKKPATNEETDKLQAPGTVVSLNQLVCPIRMRTKLRYSERVGLTSTAGILTSTVFWGNNLFDPNFTGTGSQPEGFDQWALLYDSYTVYRSRIKVTIAATGATTSVNSFRAVLMPQTTSNLDTTIDDAAASPLAVEIFNQGSTNPARILRRSLPVCTVVGVRPEEVLDNPNYSALVTASPTEGFFWQIYLQAMDLASTVVAFAYIEIDYYVDFSGRKKHDLSAEDALRKQLECRRISSDPKLVEMAYRMRLSQQSTSSVPH